MINIEDLIGGIIARKITSESLNEDLLEGFQVKKNGKLFNCLILGDEEGNHDGFLEITEQKEGKKNE